ncbi:aromatic ring-hydroxylating dioxygenase subunit alpha [Verticiella sediminum]|nr:aromatic ring-hydroxylating dioxygenase subunit alpha [Verticiella sediminum]
MNRPNGAACQPYDPRVSNFPRQLWWVAAHSAQITADSLVSRKLLGVDVLLSRRADGTVWAIEDRCVHRGLPLSMGWKQGDEVVCRYHGFRYDTEGKVTCIPTQNACPKTARVDSFPVVENPPFVWIWMGDPAAADPAQAPDFAWLRDPGWVWASRHMNVRSNYMLLKENVLDLTHFPFAHKSTFGALDDYESAAEFSYEDGVVTFVKRFMDQPLSPIYDRDLNLGGRHVDRIDMGKSISPAEHFFTATIRDPMREEPYLFRFQHLTTPQTNSSHHYWWVISRNYGLDPHPGEWFEQIASTAFREDKEILEAIQLRLNESPDPTRMPEVSAIADRGGLLARRQLRHFLEREQASAT